MKKAPRVSLSTSKQAPSSSQGRHATESAGVAAASSASPLTTSSTGGVGPRCWEPELAPGAFQDSTLLQKKQPVAGGSVAQKADTRSQLLAAAMSSSAPLLGAAVEDSQGKHAEPVSTSSKECDTSLPAVQVERAGGVCKVKDQCMLSATDSGLYSEEGEANSEGDEYLEVFSEDEEELVDDGWLIPADEVALDKVVAYNKSETVYK